MYIFVGACLEGIPEEFTRLYAIGGQMRKTTERRVHIFERITKVPKRSRTPRHKDSEGSSPRPRISKRKRRNRNSSSRDEEDDAKTSSIDDQEDEEYENDTEEFEASNEGKEDDAMHRPDQSKRKKSRKAEDDYETVQFLQAAQQEIGLEEEDGEYEFDL